MGRKDNITSGKVSRSFGFYKSGRPVTQPAPKPNCSEQETSGSGHPEKQPIRLSYRRGVLISKTESEVTTANCRYTRTNKSPQIEQKVIEKCQINLESKGDQKEGKRGESEQARSIPSWKIRNSNSLENCSLILDSSQTFNSAKVERKLSLPADMNKLEKVQFEDKEMGSLSNGHVKLSHCTNNPQTKIPRLQKDFITGFALLEACQSNNERKVKDLVRKMCCMSSAEVGPLVNFQDQTGRTALSFACAIGNVTIIEELSKLRRLDPNLGDNDGNAPLHYAAQAGQSTAVDLLLLRFEGIIDPNVRNSTGLTPLHKAALQGRSRVAKSLIVSGASPHIRDYSRNMTAMEWARLCGRHICAEVIVRCARDNHCPSVGSPPGNFSPNNHRTFPTSQSAMELKRLNSDDSPFYQLQNVRNTISGANWLKNKIRKAIGSSSSSQQPMPRSESSFGLMSNLGGATLCAGSLLLPSIKPILDQQKPKVIQKMKIPTVQVTPVKR